VFFPEESAAAQILTCLELVLQNRLSCCGAAELWGVPVPVLALLQLRLGCRMAGALCCSVVCGIGAGCGLLAVPPAGLLLGDSKTVIEGAARHVLLSYEATLELPLVELQLRMGEVQRCMISVADTPTAAKKLQCS